MSNLPYNTAIPGAPTYAQTDLTAQQAYSNALARVNQQRQSTLGQYGYQGTVNPDTGVISNVTVNPNAPYGLYQQMLRQGAMDANAARDDAASRGLVGGLAHQGEDVARYGFGQQSAQLGTNLTNALSGLQDQQDAAKYTYDQALWQAQLAAAQGAISQGNYDPANYNYPDYNNGDYPFSPTTTGPFSTPRTKVASQVATRGVAQKAVPVRGVAPGMAHGGGNYGRTTVVRKPPAARPGIGRRK